MRLFHISDLHIGRYLHNYSLLEEQKEVLGRIIRLCTEYRPDVMMIAGDVFDKSVPSGEAYTVFDHFLNELSEKMPDMTTLIIAGNHDSAERLRYASSFLERHHIYISVLPPANASEHLKCITLTDDFGKVNFYLLPFTKPVYVRGLFEDPSGITWSQAVERVLEREPIDYAERNVILSHQFYGTGEVRPETCDSEQCTASVGGSDMVSADLLSGFEYAALGHLHGAQKVFYSHVRYSGTPFPYSISEEHHKKSLAMIDLGAKGEDAAISLLPIESDRKVRTVRGNLADVLKDGWKSDEVQEEDSSGLKKQEKCRDYVSIVLTDDNDGLLTDARDRLEERYERILEIRVDNKRTRAQFTDTEDIQESWSLSEAFQHFFSEMNQRDMNEQEAAVMQQIFEGMDEEG